MNRNNFKLVRKLGFMNKGEVYMLHKLNLIEEKLDD